MSCRSCCARLRFDRARLTVYTYECAGCAVSRMYSLQESGYIPIFLLLLIPLSTILKTSIIMKMSFLPTLFSKLRHDDTSLWITFGPHCTYIVAKPGVCSSVTMVNLDMSACAQGSGSGIWGWRWTSREGMIIYPFSESTFFSLPRNNGLWNSEARKAILFSNMEKSLSVLQSCVSETPITLRHVCMSALSHRI
jgi:hypothetical protein